MQAFQWQHNFISDQNAYSFKTGAYKIAFFHDYFNFRESKSIKSKRIILTFYRSAKKIFLCIDKVPVYWHFNWHFIFVC